MAAKKPPDCKSRFSPLSQYLPASNLMIECWNGPLLEDDNLGADSPEVGVLGKELLGWSSRTIQTILLHISK